MIRRGLICLLFTAFAWGQAAKPAAPAPHKPAPPAAALDAKAAEPAKIAPDAAVITIQGLCDNPPADKSKAADCKTVVTRAEFEKLVDALGPTMAPTARRQLATRYANALVMVHEAHKMGLDQSPRFEELMRVMRVQVMNQELGRVLQEKAAQVPDKDVEDYYHKNDAAYQEADLQRLYIPRSKQVEPPKEKLSDEETKKRQQEAEEAMKKEAETLHARAAAGEDFAKLQDEAYASAGIKAKPPSTSMGKVRRTSLPPDQASVTDLKPGEISQLISNPSAYFVYKVGEKDTLPMDKVREEIVGTLRQQRLQDSMQAVQQSATPTFDENYFAVPTGPTPQGMPILPRGAKPQPPPSGPQ
jgi:hypothetical protein